MVTKKTEHILFDQNPTPIIVFNPDNWDIVEVNKATIELYGFNQTEFKNLNLKDIRPLPDQCPVLAETNGKTPVINGDMGLWKHQGKYGKTFNVQIHVENFEFNNQQYKIAFLREITHLSKEQEVNQLVQKETRYHLENTTLGLVEWDGQVRVQNISNRITDMLGYELKDLFGKNARELSSDLVISSDRAIIQEKIDELVSGLVSKNKVSLRIYKKNGDIAWTKWNNSAIRDENNQLVSILSMIEDVTEEKLLQQELQKKGEMYRLLAENSSDVISKHNPEGIYTYVSPSIEKMTGYSPEELIGKDAYDFFHPKDVSEVQKSHHYILQSDNDYKIPYRFKTKSGSYVWVETISKTIRDPKTNEINEIHATTRNISDRIEYEQQLQQKIYENQTLLQEIHHRVKNNLAVVSAMFEFQKLYVGEAEVNHILSNSQLRIKTMAVIHDMLYHSKSLSKVEISQILEELASSAKNTISPGKNIRILSDTIPITLNINQAVPCALLINEIVCNSVEHAFNGKDKGEIKFQVKSSNKNVVITIQDNGKGLPDEFINQESNTLGLTMIKSLAIQLKADLKMKNNGGAVVEFSFLKKNIKGSSSAFFY